MLNAKLIILKAHVGREPECANELLEKNFGNQIAIRRLILNMEDLTFALKSFTSQKNRLFEALFNSQEWFFSLVVNVEALRGVASVFPDVKDDLFAKHFGNIDKIIQFIPNLNSLRCIVHRFPNQQDLLFMGLINDTQWFFNLVATIPDWKILVEIFPNRERELYERCVRIFGVSLTAKDGQLKDIVDAFPNNSEELFRYLFDYPGNFVVKKPQELECIFEAFPNQQEELLSRYLDDLDFVLRVVSKLGDLKWLADNFTSQGNRLATNLLNWEEWFFHLVKSIKDLKYIVRIFPEYKEVLLEKYLERFWYKLIVNLDALDDVVTIFPEQGERLTQHLIALPECFLSLVRNLDDLKRVKEILSDKSGLLCEKYFANLKTIMVFIGNIDKLDSALKFFPNHEEILFKSIINYSEWFSALVKGVKDFRKLVSIFNKKEQVESLFERYIENSVFLKKFVSKRDDLRNVKKTFPYHAERLFLAVLHCEELFAILVKYAINIKAMAKIFPEQKPKLFTRCLGDQNTAKGFVKCCKDLNIVANTFNDEERKTLCNNLLRWEEWFFIVVKNVEDLKAVTKTFPECEGALFERVQVWGQRLALTTKDLGSIVTAYPKQKEVILKNLLGCDKWFFNLAKDVTCLREIVEIFSSKMVEAEELSDSSNLIFNTYREGRGCNFISNFTELQLFMRKFSTQRDVIYKSVIDCNDCLYRLVNTIDNLKKFANMFPEGKKELFKKTLGNACSIGVFIKTDEDSRCAIEYFSEHKDELKFFIPLVMAYRENDSVKLSELQNSVKVLHANVKETVRAFAEQFVESLPQDSSNVYKQVEALLESFYNENDNLDVVPNLQNGDLICLEQCLGKLEREKKNNEDLPDNAWSTSSHSCFFPRPKNTNNSMLGQSRLNFIESSGASSEETEDSRKEGQEDSKTGRNRARTEPPIFIGHARVPKGN